MSQPGYTGYASGRPMLNHGIDANMPEALPSEMRTILSRLEEILNIAAQQGDRLEGIDARLTGAMTAESQGKNPNGPIPVPSGIISEINVRLDAIMARLSRSHGTISHLSDAI